VDIYGIKRGSLQDEKYLDKIQTVTVSRIKVKKPKRGHLRDGSVQLPCSFL